MALRGLKRVQTCSARLVCSLSCALLQAVQRSSCSQRLLFVEAAGAVGAVGAVAIGAVGGVSAAVETVHEASLVAALLSVALVEPAGWPGLLRTVVVGLPVAWLILALLAGLEVGAHVADDPPDLIVTSAKLRGDVLHVLSESVGLDGVLNVAPLGIAEVVAPLLLDLAVELVVNGVPVDGGPVGVGTASELSDVGQVLDANPAPGELLGEVVDVLLVVARGRHRAVNALGS